MAEISSGTLQWSVAIVLTFAAGRGQKPADCRVSGYDERRERSGRLAWRKAIRMVAVEARVLGY
jgi:hypothetical protein